MNAPRFHLERDPHGRLVHTAEDGRRSEGCVPVRAFPIGAPNEGLSIVGPDGHELEWVAHLDLLSPDVRRLVDEDLAVREFSPVILRIRSATTFSTPSTWDVETDRGDTLLVLDGEEDIRRLDGPMLLITDTRGVQFRVPDRFALDKPSRRVLERFL